VTASISYPVIDPSGDALLTKLAMDQQELALERVVDVNVMARRALKDQMPGMVLRGFTRALAKGVMQDQLQKNAGLFGAIVGMVPSVATEKADDRMWRMLPGRIYVARGYLPPGSHQLAIDGRGVTGKVDIGGQYALVPLRIYGDRVLVGEVARIGTLAPDAAAAAAAPDMASKSVAVQNR